MKYFRPEPSGGVIFDARTFWTSFTASSDCPPDARQVASIATGRSDILSAPVAIYFELTRRCNLHCRQCFASCRSVEQPELTNTEVRQILQQCAAAGVINVRFTGGEPSMRTDLFDILRFARELGLVVSLQTNGVYPEPESFIASLAGIACEQVTVSIDGLEAVHDSLRGSGSFNAVKRALHLFASNGVKVRLNLLAHRQNLAQMSEIFAFAAASSAGINIFHIRPIGRARELQHLLLAAADIEMLAEQVKSLMSQYPGFPVACSAIGSQRRPAPVDIPVPAGFTALCLSADGLVWPHHYASYLGSEYCLGRMPGDQLQKMWAFSPVLDEFRKTVQQHFENCDRCQRLGTSCYGFDFESLIIERQSGSMGMLCSRFSGRQL